MPGGSWSSTLVEFGAGGGGGEAAIGVSLRLSFSTNKKREYLIQNAEWVTAQQSRQDSQPGKNKRQHALCQCIIPMRLE